MLGKLKRKMQGKKDLLLSEAHVVISCVPGTDQQNVSDSTIDDYGDALKRMIEFTGDVPVQSITRQQYAEFHEWLANRGTNITTTNNYRRRCRTVWNKLAERDYDVCNIAGITKQLRPPDQTSSAITDHHLTAILEVANVRDAAIILYMAESGFRRQTVGRITVADTEIWQRPDGEFRIASKIPKEKSSPERLIIAEHAAALACKFWLNIRRHQDSPWLFNSTKDGGPLSVEAVSSIFYKLRQRANLPAGMNIHPHALRHRFAQKMLDEFDLATVAGMLAISPEVAANVYGYRSREELMRKRFGDDYFPRFD
jgi:site-specific recombinase XerD